MFSMPKPEHWKVFLVSLKDLLKELYSTVVNFREENKDLTAIQKEKEQWKEGGNLKIKVN